ncbi:MAG: hypothetical protein ACRDEA_19675, partial [Microcystaceae cyanobacterium]
MQSSFLVDNWRIYGDLIALTPEIQLRIIVESQPNLFLEDKDKNCYVSVEYDLFPSLDRHA